MSGFESMGGGVVEAGDRVKPGASGGTFGNMFDDARSRRVVFVAHCILNQNAISDGTADFAGSFEPVVDALCRSGVGMCQMPCPELLCLGLDRRDREGGRSPVLVENSRIRRALDSPSMMECIGRLT